MKRRSVIMIIMTFMLLTLVGVGFAAWIITAPTTDEEVTGNIKVETVESKVAWQFDAKWVNSPDDLTTPDKTEIVFGTPETSVSKAWLTNPTVGKENLTVYLHVKAKLAEKEDERVQVGEKDYAKVTLNVVAPNPDKSTGQPATIESVLSTYLGDVASVKVTLHDSDAEVTELTAQQLIDGVVLKITFGWKYKDGESDVTTNPYTYFNAKDYETYHDDAETYLSNLYTKLDKCTFKVVLTADVKTGE